MFDKKKCCKSKTVVDYALSPEGQKSWRSGVYSVGIKVVLKGCLMRQPFLFINDLQS
jgi:hypothetical protein